jgi:predicted transcriptional regulator
MTLPQIQKLLQAALISEAGASDIDIEFAKASDLMSDVLAFSRPFSDRNTLLITGLTNKQVVRTCEIAGVGAIIFVRGKNPSADTIELAEQCQIPLLTTKLKMFEACGILYTKGIKCASPQDEGQSGNET